MSNCNILVCLSERYPQILLPIEENTQISDLYRKAVHRGHEFYMEPNFFGSTGDSFVNVTTTVGEIGILQLGDRRDFEHAYCALANKCEPMEIPPSVGAVFIDGLNNWEKIRNHKREFFTNGGLNWSAEFRRFTADKKNYQDKLILLSSGYYSGISPEQIGLPADEWKEKSLVIRKYHELTHFIYRTVYPGDRDVIRDEVLADYIGIKRAFGSFDPAAARKILGISGKEPSPDSRLRHYVPGENLYKAVNQALYWIDILHKVDNCIMKPFHDFIITEEPYEL